MSTSFSGILLLVSVVFVLLKQRIVMSAGATCFYCGNSDSDCDRLLDMLQLSSFDNCEPDEDSCRIVVEGNNYPIVGICTRYCYSTSSTIYCVNQNVKQTTPASLEKVGSKNKLAMNTNESCPRATYSLALLASLTYMSVNSIVF